MQRSCLLHGKITVTGPRNEIDSLVIWLRNEVPSVHMVKSTLHFPFWKSFKDLFLLVYGEELEEVMRKISNKTERGSIHRGWIDHSQICHPIYIH